MVSTIERIEKPKELVFKHLGEMVNAVEDTESDRVKAWNGSLEAYFLDENNGKTVLRVEVDVDNSYKDMMDIGFTKGLEVVKNLSEKS